MVNIMSEMQKVTFEIQPDKLKAAMEATGKGISETLREAVDRLVRIEAGKRLMQLRGKVKFNMDTDAARQDKDWWG